MARRKRKKINENTWRDGQKLQGEKRSTVSRCTVTNLSLEFKIHVHLISP